jgi:hypothetical protein
MSDFAEYHIASNADVGEIDVTWIDEDDRHVNPMGVKGISELGICMVAQPAYQCNYSPPSRPIQPTAIYARKTHIA